MDRSLKRPVFFTAALSALIFLLLGASTCKERMEELPMGEIPFPADNPLIAEKIELGKQLFFDKRLSKDNTIACVDCHRPELAFTDGRALSRGVEGVAAQRNAPTLLNAAWLQTVMFDGELKTLEMQVIVPIQEHSEMNSDMLALIKELRAVPEYQEAAKRIFNRDFDPWVLTRSIAAYERTLISQDSPYDKFRAGKKSALTASQKRGYELFANRLYCTECHPAPHFTTYKTECNGLYPDYGQDNGRFRVSGKEADKGRFKVPTLRNIALTAPYMHDGSLVSLDEVLGHYERGGQGHVNQSEVIKKFTLTQEERTDLKNFLNSLTDTTYLRKAL